MSEIQCAFGPPLGPSDRLDAYSDPVLLLRSLAPDPAPASAAAGPIPVVGVATCETAQQGTVNPKAVAESGSQARCTETKPLDTEKPAHAAKPTKASSGAKKRKAASKDKHRHLSARKLPGNDPKASADQAKRDEYLRKNREAASKCRAKKKDWTHQMDESYRDLSTRNQLLRAELDILSNSVYELKEMVLQHADCGFVPIEGFLQAEAKRVEARVRPRPLAETSTQSSPPDRPGPFAQSGPRPPVDDAEAISGYGSMSPPSGSAWTGMGYNDPTSFSSILTAEGLGPGHGWFGKLQQA